MIRAEYIAQKVAELGVLPRFPSDQDARLVILRTLAEMVRDEAALDWLITRAINLWNKWEGIRELRAIYCSRFTPRDGIESTSAIYTDGVPPDPLLPRPLLPPAEELREWPKEELEAIGRAWAQRNRKSPAEKRRQEMCAWLDEQRHNVIVLDAVYDDALIGVAVLASDRREGWAVYDWEALEECLMEREGLTPGRAAEAVASLTSDVLIFAHPPGERARPAIHTAPVTQEQIDEALVIARARREGWTPERLAEIQAEAARRERINERG